MKNKKMLENSFQDGMSADRLQISPQRLLARRIRDIIRQVLCWRFELRSSRERCREMREEKESAEYEKRKDY